MHPVILRAGDTPVAEYVWQPDAPRNLSPRPYLHPVRTLGGIEVTEFQPPDHPHHYGVSLAIADVGGTNFWGGRTFVTDQGSTWLPDHGEQRHTGFAARDESGLTETLSWMPVETPGAPVIDERRTVRAYPVGAGWALDFAFRLANLTGEPLPVRSSATKGRPGAGYGGFFWRAPRSATDRLVYTSAAEGEAAVHGSAQPWLVLSGRTPAGPYWSLVFVQVGHVDPWFVRTDEYPGVGPALAWDRPLWIDEALERRVVTLVLDGRPERAEVDKLVGDKLTVDKLTVDKLTGNIR
jgi:hypothetical protein